jgi:hypothetical protein
MDDTHSFVVRIWHEGKGLAGDVAAWRGSIEHVGRGERRYFVDLGEIGGYIREHVAWLSDGDSNGESAAPDDLPVRDSDSTTCGGRPRPRIPTG